MRTFLVRPDGEVVFRQAEKDGELIISVLLPDPQEERLVDLEFRLADFVAFADYAASVSDTLAA